MSNCNDDLVAQERAALITRRLTQGERMRTTDVADSTGLSLRGAYRMMNRIARVIPITLDSNGNWHDIDGNR